MTKTNESPNLTPFQCWLCTFIDEKGIDLSEFVTAGDGSTLQLGDVLSAIMSAPESEQNEIKKMIVTLDFKNAPIEPYFAHLAQALNSTHKVGWEHII